MFMGTYRGLFFEIVRFWERMRWEDRMESSWQTWEEWRSCHPSPPGISFSEQGSPLQGQPWHLETILNGDSECRELLFWWGVLHGGNTNPGGQSGVSTAPPAQHSPVGRAVVVDDVAIPRSSAAKGVSTALGSEAETCGGTKRQAVLHGGKLHHESTWDEVLRHQWWPTVRQRSLTLERMQSSA